MRLQIAGGLGLINYGEQMQWHRLNMDQHLKCWTIANPTADQLRCYLTAIQRNDLKLDEAAPPRAYDFQYKTRTRDLGDKNSTSSFGCGVAIDR